MSALKKDNRVRKKKDFDTIFKTGRTVRGRMLTLRHKPSPKEKSRGAVVVSGKISKSAVQRNKIRRTLSETMREYFKKGVLNTDIIVIVQSRQAKENLKEAKEELRRLLESIR